MKILITNIYLINSAGSELYTKDLTEFLAEHGHSVTVFSPALGPIAEEIQKIKGARVINNLDLVKEEEFDILHIHHNINAFIVREYFPEVPAVMVVHGVLPEYEQPPRMDLGISKYIAVSEEVQEHLESEYNISSERIEVIRNWVNSNRFSPREKISNSPKRLMVLSNHLEDWQEEIYKKVCKQRRIGFLHVGLPENPVQDVEKYINESDVVVTLGRGAMESMACQRNVIISDIHGVDGMLTPEIYKESIKNNLSGRRYHKRLTKDLFEKELDRYSVSNAREMYEIVKRNHNREKNISKILSIYEEIKEERVTIDPKYKEVTREIKVLAREDGLRHVRVFDLEQLKEGVEQRLEEQARQLDEQARQLDEQARQLDEQGTAIEQANQENIKLREDLAVYEKSKIISIIKKYWQTRERMKALFKNDRLFHKDPEIIFIVGTPRSGTTWLWGLLTSHPDIIPINLEDFLSLEQSSFDDRGSRITSETGVFLKLDKETIRENFLTKQRRNPKKKILEKTPAHINHIEDILETFPDAKILHIVRDPRSVISSMQNTTFYNFSNGIEDAIMKYKNFIDGIIPYLDRDMVLTLKYEDLLDQTEEECLRVLKFLKVDPKFVGEMVKENDRCSKVNQKDVFRKGKKDSYKNELSEKEIARVVNELSEYFEIFGYRAE